MTKYKQLSCTVSSEVPKFIHLFLFVCVCGSGGASKNMFSMCVWFKSIINLRPKTCARLALTPSGQALFTRTSSIEHGCVCNLDVYPIFSYPLDVFPARFDRKHTKSIKICSFLGFLILGPMLALLRPTFYPALAGLMDNAIYHRDWQSNPKGLPRERAVEGFVYP